MTTAQNYLVAQLVGGEFKIVGDCAPIPSFELAFKDLMSMSVRYYEVVGDSYCGDGPPFLVHMSTLNEIKLKPEHIKTILDMHAERVKEKERLEHEYKEQLNDGKQRHSEACANLVNLYAQYMDA